MARFASILGIHDRWCAVMAALSGAAVLLQCVAVAAFLVPRLGTLTFLRLHYTVDLGVDWIDDWRFLFAFPGFGGAVLIANGFIAGTMARLHRTLATMVYVTTLLIEIAMTGGTIIAILLNS